MADDVTLITPSGGDTGAVIATDDDGTRHWQYMKPAFGPADTQTIVTATEGLPVTTYKVGSAVDSNNSTTSILTASSTYTGTGTDVLGYTGITVTIDASHDSAASGMRFEFSTDNTNWDISHQHDFDVSDQTARMFQFPVQAQYFRVVYINGGTNQTHFRVQTILHTGTPLTTIRRLDATEAIDRSAQLVKSILLAQANGSGNFMPIAATAGGNLKIAIQEFDSGAALPAGTNAIGKLAANSGVDIGDVDITSQIPGTGATNLGKAIDTAVGGTDTGIAMLAKHNSDVRHLTTAEGDYDVARLSEFGALQVAPEQHAVFDNFNATTGWSALGNDTLNLATTKKHAVGTDALTFDKVNGAANTVFAGIQKTVTSLDLGDVSPHDLLQTVVYLPSIAAIDYVFLRVGTDSSNYNEWRVDGEEFTTATFETIVLDIGDVSNTGITGNGWNPSAITYVVVGVAFDAETDTLAGIIFDEFSFHTNQHSAAILGSEVTSSVSSANVNLQKVGGSATDKGAGNASNGCQRIVIATDDINLAIISGAVSGTEMQVDVVAALPAGTNAIGKLAANSGVDIGDVDVTSSNLDLVEDAAADANPTGVAVMTVRDDEVGSTALTTADNDLQALRSNQFGELKVTQIPDSTSEFKYAVITAASGDTSIIAAAGAGIKIRVLAYVAIAGGTTTCRFESGAGGTALTGVMQLVANTGAAASFNPAGWFETGDNAALSLESTGDIDGHLTYVEI